ncbi:probable carbohydrate esterase At4g34215 isoform X1 [Dioscorea cayenensis subsp. rotundata]|uniref:Probable carbohydrate esterase At4g34215 isoform X1 n=1 Tax=Dioscorea cayennensis subsp. rotundata TaxID=55577 RepID=A0AB40D119_DIOCR|nr:probable carbohydrate esterase At4g34215 isoform X1 [Dioscorea cayenensis subsp. rotundata]
MDSTPPSKSIFILSGQSNMAGRGGVHSRKWDTIIPTECEPHPSILRFSASSSWDTAVEPLHADIDVSKACGVGPGMPFATALLPHLPPGSTIGLVPCAVGGTAIKEWERGEKLYEEMVRRSKEVAGEGEIKAVLWFQGESDSLSDDAASVYKMKMEQLIRNLREDLQLPSLPFIQVALASGGEKQYFEKVREAQLGIQVPNVVCVDPMGFSLNEDNMHLTTESQIKLGKMLAQAYLDNFYVSA